MAITVGIFSKKIIEMKPKSVRLKVFKNDEKLKYIYTKNSK